MRTLQKWDISEKRDEILFTKPRILGNIAYLYFYKMNTKNLQLMRLDYIKSLTKSREAEIIIKEQRAMIPAFKLTKSKKYGEYKVKINPSRKYLIKTYIKDIYTNPMNFKSHISIYNYYYLWNGVELMQLKKQHKKYEP